MSAVTQLEEGGGVGSIPFQAKKLVQMTTEQWITHWMMKLNQNKENNLI